MFQKYRLFFYIVIILAIGFLLWFYSAIVIYVLVAAVLSIIGQPLVQLLDRIKIPHVLSALLSLLIMIVFFLSIFAIFVPLFIREAEMISQLNFDAIAEEFKEPLSELKELLIRYDIIGANESLAHYFSQRLESLVSIATFSGIIKHILSETGAFFVGSFSVAFITFFFLEDRNLFKNIILLIVNEKYHDRTKKVLSKCKKLLQRYFIGLICDITLMMTIMSIAMTLWGVHNAMLIGFFAGLVVIIPYIGPMIGLTLAVVIGVTSALSVDVHVLILPLVLKIGLTYFIINACDGLIFQPLIYGKSVKASPLEIFLILLISGTTAGFEGMMIAIPTYTFIRIVAKEFLSQFRTVKKLTENL